MDLCAKECEATASYLTRAVKVGDAKLRASLTWRAATKELYEGYLAYWARNRERLKISPVNRSDFWGIIQILYPQVRLEGVPGNRYFTPMRINENGPSKDESCNLDGSCD
jgi:hypothetical protein